MKLAPHLDDATLLALVDRGSPAIHGGVANHLESCASCLERYEATRQRSESLAAWFAAEAALPVSRAFVAPSPRRGVGRWMRIAAALAVLFGSVALSPLGALVAGWVRGVEETTPSEASPTASVTETAYEFGVQDGALVISYNGSAVELVVRVEEVAQGSVTVVGGDGSEEVVLRQGRIDLRQGGGVAGGYMVVVPPGVDVSVVRSGIEQRPAWRPDLESVPRSWTVRPGA